VKRGRSSLVAIRRDVTILRRGGERTSPAPEARVWLACDAIMIGVEVPGIAGLAPVDGRRPSRTCFSTVAKVRPASHGGDLRRRLDPIRQRWAVGEKARHRGEGGDPDQHNDPDPTGFASRRRRPIAQMAANWRLRAS
jgi:hypothetical protein